MFVVLSDFVKAYTAVPAVCKALEKLHRALEVIEAHRFNGSMCIASGDGYSCGGNAFVAAYLNISGLGKQAPAYFPLEWNILAPAYPFEILNQLFVGHKACEGSSAVIIKIGERRSRLPSPYMKSIPATSSHQMFAV